MIKQRKGEKVRGKKCFSEFDMKDFKLTFGRDNEFGNEMIAPFLSIFFLWRIDFCFSNRCL